MPLVQQLTDYCIPPYGKTSCEIPKYKPMNLAQQMEILEQQRSEKSMQLFYKALNDHDFIPSEVGEYKVPRT